MPFLDTHELTLGLWLDEQFDRGKKQVLRHDETSDVKLLFNDLLSYFQRFFKMSLLSEHPATQTAYDWVLPEDFRSGHIEWLHLGQGLNVLHSFISDSVRGQIICFSKLLSIHPKYF